MPEKPERTLSVREAFEGISQRRKKAKEQFLVTCFGDIRHPLRRERVKSTPASCTSPPPSILDIAPGHSESLHLNQSHGDIPHKIEFPGVGGCGHVADRGFIRLLGKPLRG